MPKNVVTYIDLFAGLGGIRLGFSNGFKNKGIDTKCVFSSEIKDYAIKVYSKYYGDKDIKGDITQIGVEDIPDFDYLLAGFPCQPFSSAGGRKGFLDTRGTMFFEIERILQGKIDANKPAKGFLLENVEGLINHENGDTLKTIISHLENLGYKVSYKLLDSQYFGLAQSRKRVYIVGTLEETVDLEDFEETNLVGSHYFPEQKLLNKILELCGGANGLPNIEGGFFTQNGKHCHINDIRFLRSDIALYI